ncbi:MAG: SLC13 family permease [Chloroflexi bacterium HGW-Chloroflexi-2]|jgi:di/tricarboxylate transporter|nr:MAG: SLC13 family permease [Chloroflexi bacterium HGW-Chloroflexi-2]
MKMTLSIILLLIILVVALLFFSFEWIPPDVTAIGVLVALIVFGLVPLDQAFSGFGSDTFILLMGLLIMTAALMRTGVVEVVGRILLQYTANHPGSLLPATMISVAIMSTFINNTAAAAFFLPVILGLSQRAKFSASRLLMPMAFAAILSSSVTLVATSTNVVVSGLITQFGLEPIGMFELTPVGLPILVVGLLYMMFIGKRLVPERSSKNDVTESFDLRPYLAELRILPDSHLAGNTLAKSNIGRNYDLTVLAIIHEGKRKLNPPANTLLHEGDALLVEGASESILKIKDVSGIDIQADLKFSDEELKAEELHLAEVVLLPRSPFIGRTLKGLKMRERFDLQVVAINRRTGIVHSKIADTRLQLGDVLLVQGNRNQIKALQAENAFDVLGVLEVQRFNRKQAITVVGIFAGAFILGSLKIIALPVAMLLGALLVFVTRCITPDEAYRQVDWKVLILIGCMLALGVAMQTTGTAQYLADLLTRLVGNLNPIWLLTGFFALTVLLTQPMSNQAAAAVVIPVAVQTAIQLDLNPRTFAMMIAIAASTSYLTPLEPACLMVYGPGRYRFMDFLKVGGLLTVAVYLIAIILTPLLWPL